MKNLSLSLLLLLVAPAGFARSVRRPPPPPPAEVVEVTPAGPDRSAPPAVIPPEMLPLPAPTRAALAPGVEMVHLRVEGVRKVEVMVMFHRGSDSLCGPRAPASPADCAMLAGIWDLASEQTDAVTLESRLDQLDGAVTSWVGQTSSGLELTIPRTALAEGLSILGEVLHTPALPRKELARTRKDRLEWYAEIGPTELAQVSQSARHFGFYDAEEPWGARPDLRALKRVKRGRLARLHDRLLAESPVTVLVVGDLPAGEVEAPLRALLQGVGREGPRDRPAPYTPMAASSIVAVDMPGQEQAAIRLASAAPPRADAQQVAFGAANFALGGSFTSRLNANLREEKGWTYGAGSRYAAYQNHGLWSVGVDVEAENVAAAVAEIRAEVAGLREQGTTAEELHSAWLDEITTWNRRLETSMSAAGFYQSLLLQEEAVEDRAARLEALRQLSAEGVAPAAQAWLGEENPQLWVIVGDRQRIGAQVEGLGLPVQWITPEDAIMGRFSVARRE